MKTVTISQLSSESRNRYPLPEDSSIDESTPAYLERNAFINGGTFVIQSMQQGDLPPSVAMMDKAVRSLFLQVPEEVGNSVLNIWREVKSSIGYTEESIVDKINEMCIESLSPESFEKWEQVIKELRMNRQKLNTIPEETWTKKDVVDFANYLFKKYNVFDNEASTIKRQVGDWDFANFKTDKK